jgi:integrase
LGAWLSAPLSIRVGRLANQTQGEARYNTSYACRPYICFLAVTGRLRLDYEWLLAVQLHSITITAARLQLDLGFASLAGTAVALGFDGRSALRIMTWVGARYSARHGGVPATEATGRDADELEAALDRLVARPDFALLCGMDATTATMRRRTWASYLFRFRTVLFHRGAAGVPPKKLRTRPPASVPVQREMVEVVERWLRLREATMTPLHIYKMRLALRRFLEHLAEAAPEVASWAFVTREHALGFVRGMVIPKTSPDGAAAAPLARGTVADRAATLRCFVREIRLLNWPEAPTREVLGRYDMPRTSARVPRFIPESELERLMVAVRGLACPFARAALLTARWSGARRSEIRRLRLDCLDKYPDGTPRLRIPAGKTLEERLVPLHKEAAEALRVVQAIRAAAPDRPLRDERTGDVTRHLFAHQGRLLGVQPLFETSLQHACEAAGLVDVRGRPAVSAHRFRHTVGTQLAERGARIHTIMSVLGHRSPSMSLVYSRISDPEILRDYRAVLEPGAVIAGPGAEAIRSGALGKSAVDWLKTNFFKTELELGHCLRLPAEGPCECEIYLGCSRFVTTPAYAPRLGQRHKLELTMAEDARERGWPREVERHRCTAARIEKLLADMGLQP